MLTEQSRLTVWYVNKAKCLFIGAVSSSPYILEYRIENDVDGRCHGLTLDTIQGLAWWE
jgi:hypothetical protein